MSKDAYFYVFFSILALSYNQPKFCPSTTWNPNAVTFAEINAVDSQPYGFFVNANNTVYVADPANGQIQIWLNNNINPTRTISGNLSNPLSIFVTSNGNIYVYNNYSNGQVDKWTLNTNTSVSVMNVTSDCYGLFVDINDTLYCSLTFLHQVISKPLNNGSNASTIVAGNGSPGSDSNMLNSPRGIFVDINLDLYVADCNNSRIQLFQLGQSNATTVAGNGSSSTTITLYYPTGIILDADKYLFIVDSGNNRIVGSGPTGFRCLVGCSGSPGSASNRLDSPQSMAFDSYGNIFVTDTLNNRIQKFTLFTNSCGKYEYTCINIHL